MKIALLLPGYLDSPDYLHMITFEKRLKKLGYYTDRIDPCNLWKTGDVANYSITNYLKQVDERINTFQNPDEVLLVGHSLGGVVSIIAGSRIKEVTKIVSLCPTPDIKKLAEKWKNREFAHSQRDLPNNPTKFRSFDIPKSFANDGLTYSATDEVKKMYKPLMIFIALGDTVVSPKQTEKIVSNANKPYVVRRKDIGHDFRLSKKECEIVMGEIEKFINR